MSDQHQLFEQLKHIDENGMEFWSARSISKLLGYSEYRHFQPVITKAKEACINSEHAIEDHFEDVLAMVTIGSGAQREVPDGGLDQKAIHARKGLKKSQKILDHMGSTELAANLFRATQAEEKLRRDNVQNKQQANQTHYEVGQKVRQTIAELGGTMPENLPAPEKSIKQLESAAKKLSDNNDQDTK